MVEKLPREYKSVNKKALNDVLSSFFLLKSGTELK